jgi:hypothetical protein
LVIWALLATTWTKRLALYGEGGHNPLDLVLGIHAEVASLAFQAFMLWLMGYPHQASRTLARALAAAHHGNHLTTLDIARVMAAMIYSLLARDSTAAERQLEELRSLSVPGSAIAAWIDDLAGWVQVERGQSEVGLEQMREG